MRFILCLMAVITLLSTTGCIFPGGRGDGGEERRWEHHDHDGDHDDHDAHHDGDHR